MHPFNRSSAFAKPVKFLIDTSAVLFAFFLTYYIRLPLTGRPFEILGPIEHYYFLLLISLPVWWTNLFAFRAYSNRITDLKKRILFFAKMAMSVLLCVILILFVFQEKDFNRTIVIPFVFLSSGMMLLWRMLLREILTVPLKRLLLVGDTQELEEVIKAIRKASPQNLEVAGLLSEGSIEGNGIERLGTFGDLFRVLNESVIDEVLFAMSLSRVEQNQDLFSICKMLGLNALVLSRIQMEEFGGGVNDFFGLPFLSFPAAPVNSPGFVIKAVADRILALAGIILLAPLVIIIAILIKVLYGSPVLFIQERIGLNGRKFRIFKFRTMVLNADEQKKLLEPFNEMSGPVFKIKNDPRVTFLGRYLRRFSLDELPQMWNVLRGDMSLVGPRPLPVEEMMKIPPKQRRRLSVKPGITCLWQSKGRNELDYEKWMSLDLEYIDKWSLWLDLKILFRTLGAVVFARGAS